MDTKAPGRHSAQLTITTKLWSGWSPAGLSLPPTPRSFMVEEGGLVRLGDGDPSYELRVVAVRSDGAVFVPEGDGPARRNADETINLAIGQSAGFATRTTDAGMTWDVTLTAIS